MTNTNKTIAQSIINDFELQIINNDSIFLICQSNGGFKLPNDTRIHFQDGSCIDWHIGQLGEISFFADFTQD